MHAKPFLPATATAAANPWSRKGWGPLSETTFTIQALSCLESMHLKGVQHGEGWDRARAGNLIPFLHFGLQLQACLTIDYMGQIRSGRHLPICSYDFDKPYRQLLCFIQTMRNLHPDTTSNIWNKLEFNLTYKDLNKSVWSSRSKNKYILCVMLTLTIYRCWARYSIEDSVDSEVNLYKLYELISHSTEF